MPKLKGLLDSANAKLAGLLGDFPQGFNAGAVAGFPGWAGDMAYLADTARLALTGADQQAAPENYVGTTDYIAKQAGFPVPQTLSGQLGAAVGGLMSPGPGDLARFAPLGAMFLGVKAKTAMPDVLEYAQAMEKAGKSPDEIWQTTGKLGQPWFKGADGQWRFEISDKEATYNPVFEGPSVSDAMHHPELFAAYPDIAAMPARRSLEQGYGADAVRGSFDPQNGSIVISDELGTKRGKATLLHEIEHAIQQKEGFAQGGSPNDFALERFKYSQDMKRLSAREALDEYAKTNNGWATNAEVAQWWESTIGEKLPEWAIDDARQMEAADLQKRVNSYYDTFKALPEQASEVDAYKRLAGETEARNVPTRMNLASDEITVIPPWATQDVPTEQQIVRFGDGPAMAIEDFAARRAGKAKPYRELAMDEASRIQRASEQGYNTDVYHGTAEDVTAFDPAKFGASTGAHSAKQGVWTVSDETTAAGYAQYAANDAKIKALLDDAAKWEKKGDWDKYDEAVAAAEDLEKTNRDNDFMGGQNVMPLKVRGKYLEQDMGGAEFVDVERDIKTLIDKARRAGYDGVKFHNLADDVGRNARPATHVLTFDPKNIRSKNAAFDPAKKDSANLLAGAAATALGLGLAKQQLSEQERRNGM